MEEPINIIEQLNNQSSFFADYKVLVTAGPTREHIDPARYISNHSSGKMGYALAQAFYDAGACVSLITGPTTIKPPTVDQVIQVITAEEMYNQVMCNIQDYDIFVSAAAVSDYTVKTPLLYKMKKNEDRLTIKLSKTKDILSSVTSKKKKIFSIGFAAETDCLLKNAEKKLYEKKLDLIILNKIEKSGFPFDSDKNKVTILCKNSDIIEIAETTKVNISKHIVKLTKKLIIA